MNEQQIKSLVDEYALMEFYSQNDCPTGNDKRYTSFRIYKRKLLYKLFSDALKDLDKQEISVLDLGCGYSLDMDYIVCRMTNTWRDWDRIRSVKFKGIDADPKAIAFSTQRFKSLGLDHSFELCDITKRLPFRDGSVDIVICSEVVEHLEEPDKLIQEVFRILGKNGVLVLTTDNKRSLFSVFKKEEEAPEVCNVCSEGWNCDTLGHIHLKPTRYWEKLCRKAGFSVSFGFYESVQRFGKNTPLSLAINSVMVLILSLLPARAGRFLSCTTALLCRKKTV